MNAIAAVVRADETKLVLRNQEEKQDEKSYPVFRHHLIKKYLIPIFNNSFQKQHMLFLQIWFYEVNSL